MSQGNAALHLQVREVVVHFAEALVLTNGREEGAPHGRRAQTLDMCCNGLRGHGSWRTTSSRDRCVVN